MWVVYCNGEIIIVTVYDLLRFTGTYLLVWWENNVTNTEQWQAFWANPGFWLGESWYIPVASALSQMTNMTAYSVQHEQHEL